MQPGRGKNIYIYIYTPEYIYTEHVHTHVYKSQKQLAYLVEPISMEHGRGVAVANPQVHFRKPFP